MEKLIVFLVLVAVSAMASPPIKRTAIVYLKNPTNEIEGYVTFEQVGLGSVRVTGNITGLTDGKHGFHVHERGDISTCAMAGGHYNPLKKPHGAPNATDRHVGDLGNIESKAKQAIIDFEDHEITLVGEFNIIGRAVVVHEKEDDLGLVDNEGSKSTGNAGGRLVCGVIGIKDPVDNWRINSASSRMTALSVGILSILATILTVF